MARIPAITVVCLALCRFQGHCWMALTNEEAELIRDSFRVVSQIKRQAANRFYQNLFEAEPGLRNLFINDMDQQGALLMSKLGLVVAEIQNLDALVPMLEDLALRHVAYGVKPEDYDPVGEALVQMLADVIGDDFSQEARDAWAKAYGELATRMISSAYSHRKVPAN